MSEENNSFENQDNGYTQAPESSQDNGYNQAPENEQVQNYGSKKGQGIGFGVTSMILGILSIILICCSAVIPYLPIVAGVIAVIFGIVQIVKNEKKGMAIAGIICGAIGVIAYVALIFLGLYVLQNLDALQSMDSELYNQLMQELQNSGVY